MNPLTILFPSKPLTRLASIFMVAVLSIFTTTTVVANDVATAEKRVIDVTSSVVNKLEQNKAQFVSNDAALNALVRREILPLIDFDAMSKLTLGKHWRTASASQRTRFISAFREMLVNSYAKTMVKYAGSTIRAGNSAQQQKPGYVLVRTNVTPKGASSISANYSLRKLGNDWKAYNVEIAGINLITNFRTNFTREVSAKGLDSLIARLEKAGK